jgi:hypothetical protein
MRKWKRYLVHYRNENGEGDVEIVALSAVQAINHIKQAPGWQVLSCKPLSRSRLPASWEIDKAALHHAGRMLKLRWPVVVTRTSSMKHTGRHALRAAVLEKTPRHYITVDKAVTAERANSILWHELCHAMQAERTAAHLGAGASAKDMLHAWSATSTRSRKHKYSNRPIELEARSYEQCAEQMKLTKEVKS